MNKKRLSVVMAGAMLASSVAPVLAATGLHDNGKWDHADQIGKKYVVNGANRGILVRDLRNLLKEHVYANEASNNNIPVSPTGTVDVRNTSVYAVRIDNGAWMFDVTDAGIRTLETAINNAQPNSIIEVLDRGHVVKNGKYYICAQEDITLSDATSTYTATTLKAAYDEYVAGDKTNTYAAIESMDYDANNKTLTVHTRAAADELELKTIVLTEGKEVLDFTKPVDEHGDSLVGRKDTDSWSDLAGFETKKETVKIDKGEVIDGKTLAKITVSDVDTEYVVKLSDLYDGLLLTEKGQELLTASKEYIDWTKASNKDLKIKAIDTIKSGKNGIFTFDLVLETYNAKNGVKAERLNKTVVKVSSNNKGQLEIFQKWIAQGYANVEVLAGDNRYETAVKVAKENAKISTVAENGNIVLVNGNALVDGLAAAPLAASVVNKGFTTNNGDGGVWDGKQFNYVAPILLTESNSIPKSTKSYIRELVKEQRIKDLDKVTVYLVGGEAVISKSLENELRDLGLRVVRAGGANREETSLKVAEVMKKDGNESKVDLSNAFIVGAEGEADAMSIASVAAREGNPIIVSKKGGLSEEALDTVVDWKNEQYNTNKFATTIIGGKNVVSEETKEALEAKGLKVNRISGSNRQATNAAVIDAYYGANTVRRIVVSKDGQKNKSELIDALTATSLAVKDNGPIVLATNKMSTAQINTLEKKSIQDGVYVYQVGHGVARDVLKTLAQRLNLAK